MYLLHYSVAFSLIQIFFIIIYLFIFVKNLQLKCFLNVNGNKFQTKKFYRHIQCDSIYVYIFISIVKYL